MKEVQIKASGGALSVKLTCEIDHHTAKIIREAVDGELIKTGARELVLDFSGVSFMDSSGIGLIIGRVARAEQTGATVTVSGLSPTQRRLVRMSGIEKLKRVKII